MRTVITYGVGGYNPDLPNDNIVSIEELPDIDPPAPTAEERLATLIAALTDAQSLEEIRDAAAAAGGQ